MRIRERKGIHLRRQRASVPFMPIRPSQRWFYPIDWTELSAAIRFGRAKGCCERCGRPHGKEVWHLSRQLVAARRGLWFDEWGSDDGAGRWRCERGRPLPKRALPTPERLAELKVQLAFWAGLERRSWPARSRVTLACCHLDHDPTNNDPRNLAALCQHCHLEHDRRDNMDRRLEGYRARRGGLTARLPLVEVDVRS